MSEVKRYGHIGYLVTATPHLLSLYSEMKVYVSATDFDSAVDDFNTVVRQKMEFAKERGQLKAENEALRNAMIQIIEMNRMHAECQYGDPDKAETWSCVTVAREALSVGGQS